jgi:hypothetical protein
MVMAEKYLQVVLTSPTAGREDEFNEWYENVHVPQVLRMPGFLSGQRFRLVDSTPSDLPRYLAVYEIESDDIAETLETITATAPTRTKSGAIDIGVSIVRMYEPIGELQTLPAPENPTSQE